MNIIEQIDDKFRAKFASDYCEVVLTNGEWQQIKEAFAKVREDALEEAQRVCEIIEFQFHSGGELAESGGAATCFKRIRALKYGE